MLTEREEAVLQLRKEGKTQAEIARLLSISQPAVSNFDRNARRKIKEAEELLSRLRQLGLLAVLLFPLLLLAPAVSATTPDPGHDASRVGAGTFPAGDFIFQDGLQVAGSTFYIDDSTGNVGIGTVTPASELHIESGIIVANGTYNSGDILGVSGAGTRMVWYPRKAAFRAGTAEGTEWDQANIGPYSVAMGQGTRASGAQSTALGYLTTATGQGSTALGQQTTASGGQSIAWGVFANASGSYATAGGLSTTANGSLSIALGNNGQASATNAVAIGQFVHASAANSFALGQGISTNSRLTNTIPSSLIIGFDSTSPTLFVNGSSVGIGTVSTGGSMLKVAGGWLTIDNNNYFAAENSSGTRKPLLGINSSDTILIGNVGGTAMEVAFYAGEQEAIRLDTAGNVGIGAVTPNQRLHVSGNVNITGTLYAPEICLAGDCESAWPVGGNGTGGWTNTSTTTITSLDVNIASGALYVNSSSGDVGIGTVTPIERLHLQDGDLLMDSINGSHTPRIWLAGHKDGTLGPKIEFNYSRGNWSSPTAVQNEDKIGIMRASGYNGSAYQQNAHIMFQVDGAITSGIVPTAITFTTGDASGTSERVRINPNGRIGINTTSPNSTLHVIGDANVTGAAVTATLDTGSGAMELGDAAVANGDSNSVPTGDQVYDFVIAQGYITDDASVPKNHLANTGTLNFDWALSEGGTGASLTDPGADRIMFWDDSAGAVTWLTAGSGLSISGTTISASSSIDGSGSANYLTYWSDANTVSGSGLYWDATDSLLGVNTELPEGQVHIEAHDDYPSLMITEGAIGEIVDYTTRMPVTITEQSGSSLTNFQTKVIFDHAALVSAGKSNSDGRDLRFTDDDGTTLLPFWLDMSTNNTASAVAWVNVSLTASTAKTIYLYYSGDTGKVSASNGTNTFIFFDDFEDSGYTDKWTVDSGTWVQANGYLEQTSGTAGWYQSRIYAKNQVPFSGTAVVMYEDYVTATGDCQGNVNTILTTTVGTNSADFGYMMESRGYDGTHRMYTSMTGTWVATHSNISTSTWYKHEVKIKGASGASANTTNRATGAGVGTYSTATNIANGNSSFYLQLDACTNGPRWDNIMLRQYAATEPSVSLGSEEAVSLSTTTHLYVQNQTGYVGIGTGEPGAELDVYSAGSTANLVQVRRLNGHPAVTLRREDASMVAGGTIGAITFAGDDASTASTTGAEIAALSEDTWSSGDTPGALAFSTTQDGTETLTERVRIDSAGNVGIGTTSPQVPLDISSSTGSTTARIYNRGTNGQVGYAEAPVLAVSSKHNATAGAFTTGHAIFAVGIDNDFSNVYSLNQTHFTVLGTGAVGVGTANPQSNLHIKENDSSSYAILRLEGGTNRGGIIQMYNGAGTRLAQIYATQSSSDLRLQGGGGTDDLVISSTGNVGVGVINPDKKLEIANALSGSAGAYTNQTTLRLTQSGNNNYNIGDVHSALEFYSEDSSWGEGLQAYVAAVTTRSDSVSHADTGLYFGVSDGATKANYTEPQFVIDNDGNVGIGTDNPGERLSVSGNINASGAINAGAGIDLAETFSKAEDMEGGDIVSAIDGHTVRKATRDTAVQMVGVVSTQPGITLNKRDLVNPVQVALAGRVPVKVAGSIQVGDYITISDEPGIGKAATEASFVVGRALEAGNDTTVLMLVEPGYFSPQADSSGKLVGSNGRKNIAGGRNLTGSTISQFQLENQQLRAEMETLKGQMSALLEEGLSQKPTVETPRPASINPVGDVVVVLE